MLTMYIFQQRAAPIGTVVHAWTAGLLACINGCSFWRSQNDRRDASQAENVVHRQVVGPGSSTRATPSDNLQSRPGGLRSAHTLSVGPAPSSFSERPGQPHFRFQTPTP